MLDYEKIRERDATIAFLQSCSCLPEFTALVLTRSRHVQTSPSLSPLLPQSSLPLRLLRLPTLTLVLLNSTNNWLKRMRECIRCKPSQPQKLPPLPLQPHLLRHQVVLNSFPLSAHLHGPP